MPGKINRRSLRRSFWTKIFRAITYARQFRKTAPVFLWLMCLSLCASAQPYIVTEITGTPKANDVPLRLLRDVFENETLVLKSGDILTITCLKEGARAVLKGPLSGQLRQHSLVVDDQQSEVFLQEGRSATDKVVREVSRTLGAVRHRASSQDTSVLISRGVLLEPRLFWTSGKDAVNHSLTISDQSGPIVTWHKPEQNEIDLSCLGLRPGEEYEVEFVATYRSAPASTTRTAFMLASKKTIKNIRKLEAGSRKEYADSSELTPLSIYLAYLLKQRMYAEAYALIDTPPFAGIHLEDTRDDIVNIIESYAGP